MEYYSRLYLKEGASKKEVKEAYRKLAKKFHPDKNSGSAEFEEEFKLIQEAYDKLIAQFEAKEKFQQEGEGNVSDNFQNSQQEKSNKTGSSIIKRNTRFAASASKESNDFFLSAATGILSIAFLICFIYALYDQLAA